MSRIKVLVVDDEPLAREMLTSMVGRDADLEVAGEAGDGRQAMALIERLSPEIVLIDVEMPERNGLDAVRGLEPDRQPLFIFVTAYAEYAADAFEVEALDYVLKPVREARLSDALGRAKRRIRELRLSRMAEKVVSLSAEVAGGPAGQASPPVDQQALTRIPVTTGGRTRFIETDEILWIESQDYYVRIHSKKGRQLLRASLKSLAERLDSRRFCQIHRGAIVNLREVVEVQSLFKGARALRLSDGTELRISRSRWPEVREILSGWGGGTARCT